VVTNYPVYLLAYFRIHDLHKIISIKTVVVIVSTGGRPLFLLLKSVVKTFGEKKYYYIHTFSLPQATIAFFFSKTIAETPISLL